MKAQTPCESSRNWKFILVNGEGVAKGKSWPGLLVLGEDAERDVRAKCTKILQTVDEWKDVSCGVNFD